MSDSFRFMARACGLTLIFTALVWSPASATNATGAILSSPATFAQSDDDAATDGDPEKALTLAQTATNAQNNGDYKVAAQLWESLLTDFPTASLIGKAHYNAGICYVQLQEFQKANDQLSKSVGTLSDETQLPKAYLWLGYSQFRLGQQQIQANDPAAQKEATVWLTTSTQTFNKLLEKYPKFSEGDQASFFQGSAYEDLNRQEDALKSYEKMLTFPEQTFQFEGLLAIAAVNQQLGNHTDAIKYYDQFRAAAKEAGGHGLLPQVDFQTAKSQIELAQADIQRDDTEAANKNFQTAVANLKRLADENADSESDELKSLSNESRFHLAYCLTQLGQFDDAAKTYDQLAATPDSGYEAESLLYGGRSYDRAGKTDLAIANLKRASELESPFAIDAVTSLTRIYLEKSNDPQSAYELADRWIKQVPDSSRLPALMLDRADAVYRIEDRRAESAPLFLAIADKFPENELAPAGLYNAAYTYLELGKLDDAIKTAQRFEADYATSDFLADTMEVKADAFLLKDQPAESESVFEKLVTDFPQHEKVGRWLLRSGLAKFLQQKYQAVIDQLQPNMETFKSPQQLAEANHWVGASYFHLDQFEPAVQWLEKSVAADTSWRRADETALTLARALFSSKKTDAATTVSQKLIADFPNSPLAGEAYYLLGENAYGAGKYADAFASFMHVVDGWPDSYLVPNSLYNAAWCKLELEEFEASEKLFSQLITDFPDDEMAQRAKIGRGATRRKTGNTEDSIADLKAFLETKPTGSSKIDALYELGLAQVEQSQWDQAITTFDQLLVEDTDSKRADRYHYELAWAHQLLSKRNADTADRTETVAATPASQAMDPQAMAHFIAITTETPDSPLAAEANFHLGTEAYRAEKFDDAIAAFEKCVASEGADTVREKALYKLGWAHYKQDQFDPAHQQFAKQIELFPQGELYADGSFMVAETQFRLNNHAEALAAYLVAQPAVDAANNIDPKIKWLTMLHGSQSANKTKQFDEALKLAQPLTTADVDESLKHDAWLEVGTAQQGAGNTTEAMKAYEAAKSNNGKTGARAGCLVGDLYFKQKNYDEAIKEFKLVFYKFDGADAPAEIKPWIAYALYEAARCNQVQASGVPADQRAQFDAEAIKHFETLLEKFGDDRLAPEAKKQLEILKRNTN